MMNERIKELAEQAGYHINGGKIFIRTTSEDITSCQEKFAELIVQECIDVVNVGGEFVSRPKMVERIKEHFGVEE